MRYLFLCLLLIGCSQRDKSLTAHLACNKDKKELLVVTEVENCDTRNLIDFLQNFCPLLPRKTEYTANSYSVTEGSQDTIVLKSYSCGDKK